MSVIPIVSPNSGEVQFREYAQPMPQQQRSRQYNRLDSAVGDEHVDLEMVPMATRVNLDGQSQDQLDSERIPLARNVDRGQED